jgi:hypothetical protein
MDVALVVQVPDIAPHGVQADRDAFARGLKEATYVEHSIFFRARAPIRHGQPDLSRL